MHWNLLHLKQLVAQGRYVTGIVNLIEMEHINLVFNKAGDRSSHRHALVSERVGT